MRVVIQCLGVKLGICPYLNQGQTMSYMFGILFPTPDELWPESGVTNVDRLVLE